jgi:hypothetical protein
MEENPDENRSKMQNLHFLETKTILVKHLKEA